MYNRWKWDFDRSYTNLNWEKTRYYWTFDTNSSTIVVELDERLRLEKQLGDNEV